MGSRRTLRKFLAVAAAATTLLSSSPGVAQTLSDFERQFKSDSYVGAYFRMSFGGPRNSHARAPAHMGFRAGFRRRMPLGDFSARGRQRFFQLDYLNLRFDSRGVERLSLVGQPLIARDRLGNWVYMADPNGEEGEDKASGSGVIGGGVVAVAALEVRGAGRNAGKAIGESLCSLFKSPEECKGK